MNEIDWTARAENLDTNIHNFINGNCVKPSGAGVNKYSPRDGTLLYVLPQGEANDVNHAVTVARESFQDGRWSSMSVTQRKTILYRLADLIEVQAEEFALRECLDVGKPIHDAINIDVPIAVAILRYSIEACDKFYGNVYVTDSRNLVLDMQKPRGVVGAIVGWNFPLVLAMMKIAPALATGNSVVLKPSELSSLSASLVAVLAIEAGVPEGVLNVVHGTGDTVGNALAHHMDIDLLTFTGSSNTGKRLLVASGKSNMKRLVLECGGKSPNIVFDDIEDIDGVVDGVIAKMFWNQGQVCTSGSRLLLQHSIKERFIDKLVEKTAEMKPADPLNQNSRLGALISAAHLEKVCRYINSGKREGASLLLGGSKVATVSNGFYLEPTIFDHVTTEQQIAQEEIFGPVLSILAFDDEEEALQIANSTIYGLAATVWTQSLKRAQAMAYGLDAGEVVIRATTSPADGAPLGSIPLEGHKQSGIGAESGIKGLQNYTISKSVQMFL